MLPLQLSREAVHEALADHRVLPELGRKLAEELLALARRDRRGGLLDHGEKIITKLKGHRPAPGT
jgi:hypothetical protein